jgi:hypothetical protein
LAALLPAEDGTPQAFKQVTGGQNQQWTMIDGPEEAIIFQNCSNGVCVL